MLDDAQMEGLSWAATLFVFYLEGVLTGLAHAVFQH